MQQTTTGKRKSTRNLLIASGIWALTLVAACSPGGQDTETSKSPAPASADEQQTASMTTVEATTDSAGGYPDRVFFGDTHLHTSNSMDVYLFDTPSATLDTAYRFAKGEPVTSPTTGTTWQLKTPLDFLVVADHSEMVGSIRRLYEGDPEIAETKTGKAFLGASPNTTGKELLYVYQQIALIGSGLEDESPLGITMGQLFSDLHADGKIQTAWDENIKAADMYNEPGTFTTLIGWEWSSQPAGGANLHRVIFMPQGADVASRFLPFSALDSQDPEDLWAWLDQTSAASSADFVAMPHNPNLSLGLMFPLETLSGEPVDAAYAQARMRWEPVVEMTQIKGDSETHPLLSPTDEFADYETYQFVMTPIAGTPDPKAGDYMRTGLMRGLELENEIGVNPYKTGMIGATDSHTGISAIDEDAFAGKGQKDSRPELRSNPTGIGASRGWDMGAAGFAGVWATENTRQAIFDAFKRKEVYATTGPRITVRFFGGFGLSQADASAADIAGPGYKKGVPMGRDLNRGDGAPSFLVAAMKDPNEANLDRVQIVKGWLKADGSTEERIYDVALSDGRTDGSVPVGNTVDLKTGQYSNDIGAAQLSAVWEDPDFDASQPSFYYARVLQIPTPRYSLPNAIELGIDLEETGRPATIQERAYTSPIWYSP